MTTFSSSFCELLFSLFLIIMMDEVFSELLYPLNLIDCPNLLCKVSPSNNFKGCIESD